MNTKDNVGWAPLYLAAETGHLEVVKFLNEQQADISVKDNDGCTLLHLSAQNGHLNVSKYLAE